MKFILSAMLLFTAVGCSTAGYRAPASTAKQTHEDRFDKHFQKYEHLEHQNID